MIVDIISQNDFLKDSEHLAYENVNFYFHIGPSFWERELNKRIIANLFFRLNISNFGDDINYTITYYCPYNYTEVEIDHDKLFGEMNLDGANDNIGWIETKY